ncbi:hypothetical protein [Methylocystis bryophila]|nr:hypothetical protein [Methylocystis bryophila]
MLLLQGFASSCQAAPSYSGGAVASMTAHPEASPCHDAGGSQAPAKVSHDCCAHCTAAGRDAAMQLLAAVVDFILAPTPSVVAFAFSRPLVRNPVPLGLTTSWSSRAPPRVG